MKPSILLEKNSDEINLDLKFIKYNNKKYVHIHNICITGGEVAKVLVRYLI